VCGLSRDLRLFNARASFRLLVNLTRYHIRNNDNNYMYKNIVIIFGDFSTKFMACACTLGTQKLVVNMK